MGGAGELNVVVAGARGLGKSLGVYAEVQCGKLKARTRTEAGKKQVEFGARLRFQKPADVGKIQVMVWGTHRLSRDTVLGSAVAHLDNALSSGRADASCELLTADGSHAGEILLLLQFTPSSGSPDEVVKPSMGGGSASAPPAVVEGLPVGHPAYPVPQAAGNAVTPPPAARPEAPEHAAAMYSERIIEEMRALRAGMEELKMASSKRLEGLETGMMGIAGEVEQLHVRADELEGGYESYSSWDTDDSDTEDSDPEDSDTNDFGIAPPPPPPPPPAGPSSDFHNYDSSEDFLGLDPEQNWTVADTWSADAWSFYEPPGRPLMCGRRVRILWKADESRVQEKGNRQSSGKTQWWAGYVCAYNGSAGLHKVQYDDGERECLNLKMLMECGRFQETAFGPADVGRRVKILWPFKERRELLHSDKGSLRRHCNNNNGVWYEGIVAESMRHRFHKDTPRNYFVSDAAVINYDDGDVELLDLSTQRFQYLTPREEAVVELGTPIDILWRAGSVRFGEVVMHDTWKSACIGESQGNGKVRLTYFNSEVEVVDLTLQEWQMREQVKKMW